MSIQYGEIFREVKEDEDFNHRNTLEYFEDLNPNLTPRSRKRALSGWTLPRIQDVDNSSRQNIRTERHRKFH